jgi:enamine deaminase RidA (YjgF/YER057c/UK114 family)
MWSRQPAPAASSISPARCRSALTAISWVPDDFRAQATQVFENLKAALASVGAGFEHVIKTTNFLVDVSHRPVLREVRERYLNNAAPPASTLVGVTALAFPEWMVEIEAVAMVPA